MLPGKRTDRTTADPRPACAAIAARSAAHSPTAARGLSCPHPSGFMLFASPGALRLPLAIALCLTTLKAFAQPARLPDAAVVVAPATPTPTEVPRASPEGARIGKVTVVAEDIFDTRDPKEDNWLFRLANRLHVQTRPEVIERALLFRPGDAYSARVVEETERILRANRYLYDVRIVPLPQPDGSVDVEVRTRDTWTLDIGTRASRQGGSSSGGVTLTDYNLLGTGLSFGFGSDKSVDRSGTGLHIAGDRLFGSQVSLRAGLADNSDGQRRSVELVRPFHALDARWAAGATALDDERVESVYNAGRLVANYRHWQRRGEVFGGWSDGLVAGWVRRWSVGLRMEEDRYALEPGLQGPAQLPSDQCLAGPFVRYEVIEDRVERELNRNLIGRPEFFALGLQGSLDIGRASRALGSSDDAWTYRASISRGFVGPHDLTLMTAARLSGQHSRGQVHRQQLGLQAQLYVPQGPWRLFYASAGVDTLIRADPANNLVIGGDSGLRGYPLRYQSGNHRALFTLEQRFFTDLYPWRLFRVGGAAFLDAGRAWEGGNVNATDPGWLGNVGAGLRIVNSRSAFSSVFHLDVAMPLNAAAGVRKVQLLFKTKASF